MTTCPSCNNLPHIFVTTCPCIIIVSIVTIRHCPVWYLSGRAVPGLDTMVKVTFGHYKVYFYKCLLNYVCFIFLIPNHGNIGVHPYLSISEYLLLNASQLSNTTYSVQYKFSSLYLIFYCRIRKQNMTTVLTV